MRAGSILIALAGVAIAGGSVLVASQMVRSPLTAAVAGPAATVAMAQVLVARTDIPFGQPITAEALTAQSWPVEALPAGAYTDIALLVDPAREPRRARRPITPGEPILPAKVSDFGETVTIVQKLGPNARAVAISVDAVTGVGGFVAPGDRVDIVLTQGRDDTLQAVTILQDIPVVGVDRAADADEERKDIARTVTVEVSPADGQKLALAQRAGQLSLTLRTLESASDAPLAPITLSDILGQEQAAPVIAAPAPAPQPVIRVRRGVEEAIVPVDAARITAADTPVEP